jgi:hypothetical protein
MPPELAVTKAATLEVLDLRKDGGAIRITTPSADRDRDRVMPLGGRVDRYLRNPIVQWGHMTYEPWQTVGRTDTLEVNEGGMTAAFTLRAPVNDADPQNIVMQLWGERFINSASIGFQPLQATPNDLGGLDFMAWELLEWSLVPLPANADALRLAYDAYPAAAKGYTGWLVKAGRVLSKANEKRLREAHTSIGDVLAQLGDEEGDDTPPKLFLPDWLATPEATAKALAPFLAPGISPAPAPAPIDLTAIRTALAELKAAGKRSS